MITLLTGIPGSGKSYMAVDHVSKMKDQSKVLHNIEGFKLGISLDQFSIDNKISKIDVFRKSWHEKNDMLHGWVIIIDEAAELFPKSLRDTDIIGFFDYHRHYGIDIFLITQDQKKVSPDITCLAETHYRAASGASNPLPWYLIYQQMVGGEAVSRKLLRKRKEVFALYKSTNNHSSKTINIGKIYITVALIAAIVGMYALKSWFGSFKPKDQIQTTTSSKDNQSTKNQNINSMSAKLRANQKSVPDNLGGYPYPVSTITDSSGSYIVFSGIIFKKNDFPYPLMRSRTGLVALLSPQALNDVNNYQQKLDSQQINTKPNEKESSLAPTALASIATPSERER